MSSTPDMAEDASSSTDRLPLQISLDDDRSTTTPPSRVENAEIRIMLASLTSQMASLSTTVTSLSTTVTNRLDELDEFKADFYDFKAEQRKFKAAYEDISGLVHHHHL